MTTYKTLSSLSIAAIALLTVAVPALAQTQSDRDAQSSVATQANEQTIVPNTELIAATTARAATSAIFEVERIPVNNATRNASPRILSASAFTVQHNNFTAGTSSHFVSPQLAFNDGGPSVPGARKQFRADDDYSSSSASKRVSFVPSRGQKLPE